MTIEDSKKADLWPLIYKIVLVFRFHYVENNADSVFIVFANNALVCVCSVCLYYATLFVTSLCHLMIFELESLWVKRDRIFAEK